MKTLAALLGLLTCTAALSQQPTQNAGDAPALPRDLEIELALSALPPHLRDKATVYVLGKSQTLEMAREGSNGFHTFVSRLDPNAFNGGWPYTAYRDDILLPIAFDDAGSRAHMPVYFDMAEMRASGTPAEELKAIVVERWETGQYKAPERAGISYMLAPMFRTYTNPDVEVNKVGTTNAPHYMFYAPGVSNEDIGGKLMSEHPFLLNLTPGPHGYIIQFVGQAEKKAINEEYAEMLARLCELREVYCLDQ
jgi:hypothetical protein